MARPDALSPAREGAGGLAGETARIEWVRDSCRLLRAIAAEFTGTRPFDGLTIDGLAWTSDSREIIFSRRGGSFNSLWRIAALGGAPERVSAFGVDPLARPSRAQAALALGICQGGSDENDSHAANACIADSTWKS